MEWRESWKLGQAHSWTLSLIHSQKPRQAHWVLTDEVACRGYVSLIQSVETDYGGPMSGVQFGKPWVGSTGDQHHKADFLKNGWFQRGQCPRSWDRQTRIRHLCKFDANGAFAQGLNHIIGPLSWGSWAHNRPLGWGCWPHSRPIELRQLGI